MNSSQIRALWWAVRRRLIFFIPLILTGCAEVIDVAIKEARSNEGGDTAFVGSRKLDPSAIALPPGYRIEPVSAGLTFPTAVVFDDANRPYVLEAGYSYGERYTTPRLLRIEPDGRHTVIARGDNQPWTGATFHRGAFYVAQGGYPGRIVRITMDGRITPIVDGIPSKGDHFTNGPVVGPDGWLYFGQGSITNSGVVGQDNVLFGWLHKRPKLHDVPGQDIVLTGQNFNTGNMLLPLPRVTTGAFVPFGTRTYPGQVIRGGLPANAAVMRVRPDGRNLQLYAWGIRHPFGLAFSPDGRLFATDTSYDNRGSRPIENAPDSLWQVRRGVWYGFPDYAGGIPLTAPRFRPARKKQPQFLLAQHPNVPPKPVVNFEPHTASHGLDFSRSNAFGYRGQAFVAQFGDLAPVTAVVKRPVGYKVVRVNVSTGEISDFAVNRSARPGPASKIRNGGLERPLDVQFDRTGRAMYLVDFGVITTPLIPVPRTDTGVLWRITRAD